MKTFALTLKLKSGLLTELQSDTIYGHFCWRLKEQYGEEKLSDFIKQYKSDNPIFLLSDGILKVNGEIRFPRPYIFDKPEMKNDKFEKVYDFVERKKKKERKYLNINEFNNFLSTGKIELIENSDSNSSSENEKKKELLFEESLRVSVQIDRNTYGSMEGGLFSYKPKYSGKNVEFVVLVKVINEINFKEFNCEQILKEVFTVGFGKKKSSGYGQFEVLTFGEFNGINEPIESNSFIVLGNFLPNSNDKITPIGYDFNTKYAKFGEELSSSENPFKNPMVFITAGSCFKTENSKEFYGRITNEGEISQTIPFAVQFGMPFVLNFNFSKAD